MMALLFSDRGLRRHVGEPGFTTTTTNPPTKPCETCGGTGCDELTPEDYESAGITDELDEIDCQRITADDCYDCKGTGSTRAQPGERVYFNAPATWADEQAAFDRAIERRVGQSSKASALQSAKATGEPAGLLGYGTLDEFIPGMPNAPLAGPAVRFVDCVWLETPLTEWLEETGPPWASWATDPVLSYAASLPDGWSVPPVGLLETLEATNG